MPSRTMTTFPSTDRAPRRASHRDPGPAHAHCAAVLPGPPGGSGLIGHWSLGADGRLRLEWSLREAPDRSS